MDARDGVTLTEDSVVFDLASVTANVTVTVTYQPIKLPYTVHYFFQNLDDDGYTDDTT